MAYNWSSDVNASFADPPEALPIPENVAVLGSVVATMIIALGTFGNVLILLSVLTYKSLRRSSNLFVVSLAVWDLFQTLCVRPLYVYTYLAGQWEFSQAVCRYTLVASNLSILESIIHVTVIALYRYIIIVHPARALCFLRTRTVLLVLLAMYLLPLLLVLGATLSRYQEEILFNKRIMFCSFVRHQEFRLGGVLKKVVFLGCVAVFLLFCYVRIVQTVRKSRRSVTSQGGYSSSRVRREMMLLKTVITMFISFVVTFLPLSVLYGIDTARSYSYYVYFIGVALLWSSTSTNWIIYGCVHRQYSAAYTYVLCQKSGCRPPKKRQARPHNHNSHTLRSSLNNDPPSIRSYGRFSHYSYTSVSGNHEEEPAGDLSIRGPLRRSLGHSPFPVTSNGSRHLPVTGEEDQIDIETGLAQIESDPHTSKSCILGTKTVES